MKKLTKKQEADLLKARQKLEKANKDLWQKYLYALVDMWELGERDDVNWWKGALLNKALYLSAAILIWGKHDERPIVLDCEDVFYAVDNKVAFERAVEYWGWYLSLVDEAEKNNDAHPSRETFRDYIEYPPEEREEGNLEDWFNELRAAQEGESYREEQETHGI